MTEPRETPRPLEIFAPGPAERAEWERLFHGYAAFYKVAITPESTAATWAWLQDPAHPVQGAVARRDGALVGLTHYRAMPNPLRGVEFGFVDDLFVDPAARGGGIGEALIGHVSAVARARGWPKVRWLTGDDNYRARTLYDRLATKTWWNLYELVP